MNVSRQALPDGLSNQQGVSRPRRRHALNEARRCDWSNVVCQMNERAGGVVFFIDDYRSLNGSLRFSTFSLIDQTKIESLPVPKMACVPRRKFYFLISAKKNSL